MRERSMPFSPARRRASGVTCVPPEVRAGPIYKVDEVFSDPQVQHLGIAEPLQHPTRGDVRVVGTPITMSRTPAKVVSPLPDPGADTDEILRGLGYGATEIEDFRARKIV